MAVPYQPGYSQLNSGKFGFRYKADPFVDNITPAYGMDGDRNVSPPPNMNTNPNVSQQTMQYENPGNNEAQQQTSQNQNRVNVAGSYGYNEVGKSNPMNLLPGGSYLSDFLYGQDAKFNFGQSGTTDTAGNIFQESPASGINRSYDPITGAPVGYASSSDWYGSWTGLGTEEGLGGPSSSYGQLRAAGENPISSALGSYEDSSYYIPWEDRNYGVTPAGQAGIMDTGSRLRYNTFQQNPDLIPDYTLGAANTMAPGAMNPGDFSRAGELYNMPLTDLGFDGSRMESSGQQAYDPTNAQFMDRSLIGTDEAIPGQVVYLKDSGQYGVVNESGTISTPSGTVIQTGGTWNPDYEDHDGNRGRWENQVSLLNSRTPDSQISGWEGRTGEGSGYEDGTKPGSFTPTDTWYDSGYTVDTTPGGWTDEPGYETPTTFNPGINSEYTNPANIGMHPSEYTDPVGWTDTSDYTVDTTPGGWTDEPDYDTESSSDLSSSVNEGAEGNVVDGSDSVSFSDDSQYTDPWGGDEGWWNKGGQIPNRAGGK